jgi:hypothetical protein
MRNRWEGASDLDEPATITERQLRSLRRGARAGVLAILLALAAAVAAGWSVLMGPDALAGLEGVQDVKHKVLAAIGQPAPEDDRVPARATNSLSSPGSEGTAGSARAVSGPAAPSKSTVQDSSTSRLGASNGR